MPPIVRKAEAHDQPSEELNRLPPLALSTGGGFLLGVIYVVLLITLGIMAIRKGHWIMFLIGIFIPIFWIIGALMPPTRRAGPV